MLKSRLCFGDNLHRIAIFLNIHLLLSEKNLDYRSSRERDFVLTA